jgi:hypothetical protein
VGWRNIDCDPAAPCDGKNFAVIVPWGIAPAMRPARCCSPIARWIASIASARAGPCRPGPVHPPGHLGARARHGGADRCVRSGEGRFGRVVRRELACPTRATRAGWAGRERRGQRHRRDRRRWWCRAGSVA